MKRITVNGMEFMVNDLYGYLANNPNICLLPRRGRSIEICCMLKYGTQRIIFDGAILSSMTLVALWLKTRNYA